MHFTVHNNEAKNLSSNLISVKTFEIEITTGSTKDPASGLYIGSYKLIESPSYPGGENILAVIPYGARTKLDAGRSAMVAYRAFDTHISVPGTITAIWAYSSDIAVNVILLILLLSKLLLRLFASLLYTSNYENSGPKGPFLIHKNSF